MNVAPVSALVRAARRRASSPAPRLELTTMWPVRPMRLVAMAGVLVAILVIVWNS